MPSRVILQWLLAILIPSEPETKTMQVAKAQIEGVNFIQNSESQTNLDTYHTLRRNLIQEMSHKVATFCDCFVSD